MWYRYLELIGDDVYVYWYWLCVVRGMGMDGVFEFFFCSVCV
jgi:hypothetical protein